MEKHKFPSISLTVRDRAISSKFSTHRVFKECTLCNFQKIFPSPKMAAILNFQIFCPKMAKHKFASISLTVRDRAISSKFSTHRVFKECNLCNFQKIFPSQKMAAILNFRILAKNGKTQICFYLLNRARLSDFVEIFNPQGIYGMYSLQFSKNFPLPKNGGHFEFSNFCPKWQNTKLILSP